MALSRYGGITGSVHVNEDFENINKAFNNVAKENDENKSIVDAHFASNSAHTAAQITYGTKSVKDALDSQTDQINNIVSQSGDDITEIVDARKPKIGTAFRTLKERLDTENSNLTAQLADIVINVKTFGAVGDGVADDTIAIQSALDAAGLAGGGIVYFPLGKYLINTTLNLPLVPIVIRGAGHATVLKGAGQTIMTYSGYWSNVKGVMIIEDIMFEATSTSPCLDINQDYRGFPIPSLLLNKVKFQGLTGTLVKLTHINTSYITNCVFEGGGVDSGTAQLVLIDTINFRVNSSTFFRGNFPDPGGRGILIDGTLGANPCEGFSVQDCILIDLIVGIEINDVLDVIISGNMIDQINTPLIIKNTHSVRIEGNYIASRDTSTSAIAAYLLSDTKSTEDVRIINNRIIMDNGVGIGLKMEAKGAFFFNECQVAFNRISGFGTYGIELTRVANSRFSYNHIDGATGGTSIKEVSGTNNNLFAFNRVNKGISLVNATTVGNNGFKTKNYGSATIPSGSTSVTVTHGLYTSPSFVLATPTSAQASGKQWWVASKTATTFQIVVSAAPTADLTFDWLAEYNTNI